eukprot:gene8566-8748_t
MAPQQAVRGVHKVFREENLQPACEIRYHHLCPSSTGAITHQSPELMRSGQCSKPADVFAFGVVMWEVMMVGAPWQGKLPGDVMLAVMVKDERLIFGSCAPQAASRAAAYGMAVLLSNTGGSQDQKEQGALLLHSKCK